MQLVYDLEDQLFGEVFKFGVEKTAKKVNKALTFCLIVFCISHEVLDVFKHFNGFLVVILVDHCEGYF